MSSDTLRAAHKVSPRLFWLDRVNDESGVSGTGPVAQGVVFMDGIVALRWLTEYRSTAIYASIDDVERIHGHNGKTVLRWYQDRAQVVFR